MMSEGLIIAAADGLGLSSGPALGGLREAWLRLRDSLMAPARAALLLAAKAKEVAHKAKPKPARSDADEQAAPGRRRKPDVDLCPDDPDLPAEESEEADEADEDLDPELEKELEEEIEEEIHEELGKEGKGRSDWAGPDDTELIKRFLNHDQESFARLVRKYQNKVYNLCYRILSDRDEAMDMAQEVFITVHKSLAGFRGDSLFSTWIFRVTVNHCKNRIKYLGRRRYYQSTSLSAPTELEDGEVYFEPEDEGPDPELTLASEEIQQLVQKAISALDPDHRMALVLRDIQGLAYEEIADMLDIKVGTVKSRIHRARNDLKKRLEGKYRAATKLPDEG
jgi:RNA polymerase sigma-70 factor, ECF subfamily